MAILRSVLIAISLAALATPQQVVSFPAQDGALIYAKLWGNSRQAVVLVHGGRFTKESWDQQAKVLTAAGFEVLAIDLRGFGQSKGPGDSDPYKAPLSLDVVAAVRYLQSLGVQDVSLVGGSMGGNAAAGAALTLPSGTIHKLVLLAATPSSPEQLKMPKLFIICRGDASGDGPRLPGFRKAYEAAPQPKELVVLDGSAHAQFIFQTGQGDQVLRRIIQFLSAP